MAISLLDARQFLSMFFIKTHFRGVRKRKGIMLENTRLQRNDHQSLQAMIINLRAILLDLLDFKQLDERKYSVLLVQTSIFEGLSVERRHKNLKYENI